MNLHGIVRGAITRVNPDIPAQYFQYLGTTDNPDYSRSPKYKDPVQMSIQVQPLSYGDIKKIEGLNIQGVLRSAYMSGNWEGIVRQEGKGVDYMTFNQNGLVANNWIVVHILEQWPDWTKVVVCLQA